MKKLINSLLAAVGMDDPMAREVLPVVALKQPEPKTKQVQVEITDKTAQIVTWDGESFKATAEGYAFYAPCFPAYGIQNIHPGFPYKINDGLVEIADRLIPMSRVKEIRLTTSQRTVTITVPADAKIYQATL